MLKFAQPDMMAMQAGSVQYKPFDQSLAAEYIDFGAVVSAARRQWHVVVITIAVLALLGLAYVLMAAPRYSASADVLLDNHSNLLPEQSPTLTSLFDSEASTMSQIEIFKSENVAGGVVDVLGLTANEDFRADGRSLLHPLRQMLSPVLDLLRGPPDNPSSPASTETLRQRSIESLLKNLTVTRAGQTFVINVSYTSRSPQLAADIVNAFTDSYLRDNVNAKAEAGGRASAWLKTRIDELKKESYAADAAVQNFSSKHGLVTAGGQLVSDQQLATLNAMLVQAQNDTSKAEAQYDRIKTILASGDVDANVVDAIGNPVINTLQERYAGAAQREQEIAAKLGSEHAQAKKLHSEMAQYQQLILEELSRIAGAYQSELAIARARQADTQQQFDGATKASKSASATQVQLRALQQEADNYRSLYQNYLERYQRLRQQQSFPVSDARIISRAYASDKPSLPRKPLAIGMAMAIGALLGLALAAYFELSDRTLHTAEDIQTHVGLPLIGYVASLTPRRVSEKGLRDGVPEPKDTSHFLRFAVDRPISASAETIRNAAISLGALGDARPLVIGVVAVSPEEGTTTLAANLGAVTASAGQRTLLIDSDWRRQKLWKLLAGAGTGPKQAEPIHPASMPPGLALMSPVHAAQSCFPAAGGLAAAIETMREQFDCIVIDFPAFGLYSDAVAAAADVDAFILVIHWGKTRRQDIQGALSRHPQIFEKCCGAIFNLTAPDKLKRYQGAWSGETGIQEFLLAQAAA